MLIFLLLVNILFVIWKVLQPLVYKCNIDMFLNLLTAQGMDSKTSR